MRFLFRADASPAMGTGHVMRCLALAEGLRDLGHECHFLLAEGISSIEQRVAAEGVVLSHIDDPTQDTAAEATCRYAAWIDARGIIVDGYQFSAHWRENLRRTGRPVLSFYDFAPEGALGADIVLCPSLDLTVPAIRQATVGALWLCGPAYVLLRRDLRRVLAEPPIPWSERQSLLVTFGGSDPAGLTQPVVLGLVDPPLPGMRLEVVIGGGVRDREKLASELSRLCPGVVAHVDAPNLGTLMRQAGLAVSAAGTTIGELAAFGVPSAIVVVADNQVDGARQAAAKGWCRMLDVRASPSAEAVIDLARRLWADDKGRGAMALCASGTIDGKGVTRVCDALTAAAAKRTTARPGTVLVAS